MEKKTILIIDDEKMTHIILKAMLKDDYNLIFADNAQQGIDFLGENAINLVLLDIQMPDISGIELLESLMIDTGLRNVPIIIMTGKATQEIEKKARELGAKDFMSKNQLFSDKEQALRVVKKSALEISNAPEMYLGYKQSFRNLMKILLTETVRGDFFKATRKLGVGLINSFGIDYVSFWTVQKKKLNLIISLGDDQPENFGPEEAKSEHSFKQLSETKKPYLTNNPTSDRKGIFANRSIRMGLSSEIGVPLFALTKDQLMYNNMKIPDNTPIFGFVILKRNRVFTTKEFKLLSNFIIQAGTLLWALYTKMFANN